MSQNTKMTRKNDDTKHTPDTKHNVEANHIDDTKYHDQRAVLNKYEKDEDLRSQAFNKAAQLILM